MTRRAVHEAVVRPEEIVVRLLIAADIRARRGARVRRAAVPQVAVRVEQLQRVHARRRAGQGRHPAQHVRRRQRQQTVQVHRTAVRGDRGRDVVRSGAVQRSVAPFRVQQWVVLARTGGASSV